MNKNGIDSSVKNDSEGVRLFFAEEILNIMSVIESDGDRISETGWASAKVAAETATNVREVLPKLLAITGSLNETRDMLGKQRNMTEHFLHLINFYLLENIPEGRNLDEEELRKFLIEESLFLAEEIDKTGMRSDIVKETILNLIPKKNNDGMKELVVKLQVERDRTELISHMHKFCSVHGIILTKKEKRESVTPRTM